LFTVKKKKNTKSVQFTVKYQQHMWLLEIYRIKYSSKNLR